MTVIKEPTREAMSLAARRSGVHLFRCPDHKKLARVRAFLRSEAEWAGSDITTSVDPRIGALRVVVRVKATWELDETGA